MPLKRGSWLSGVTDAIVASLIVMGFWAPNWPSSGTPARVLWAGLVAAVIAAVLFRWRAPTVSPIVTLCATAWGWLTGLSEDPLLAAAWCLYPLALRRGGRTRVIGLVAVGVLLLVSTVTAVPESLLSFGQALVIGIGAVGAAWLLGHVEAQRQAATRQTALERAAAERARQQNVLAREVHDVVGHSLSTISAEAAIIRELPGADEQEWRDALTAIELRARAALVEMQALVRSLRTGHQAVATSPDLTELVTAARVSGLEVSTEITTPPMSDETRIAVARIVQETLSNIIRHSGARGCEVSVRGDGDTVVVQVEDNGHGLPSRPTPGTGVAGMRERVEELGGSLTVTTRLEGGTRVLARLPAGAPA
ncbi:two-component sensor histidine kinase [Enemella evansiae]|nr:two-component sensor histidine kinase [Enemella evansiae]OYO19042.1 two-component sensor histidine kinase [Enemella evansiae]